MEPELLDIIKINKRWAQRIGEYSVRYLDDLSAELIDLDELTLVRQHNRRPLDHLQRTSQVIMSPLEAYNVYWGPEQEKYPYLKLEVRVFGEYVHAAPQQPLSEGSEGKNQIAPR